MNLEVGLLSKIETKEDFLLVLDERVTEDFFDEHKEVFRSVVEYYMKYLVVPEKETIKLLFPNFQFADSNEPLRFFVDKLKEKHKKNIYNKGLIEIAEAIKVDVDDAERKLQKLLLEAKSAIKTGVEASAGSSIDKAKADYLKRKDTLGIDGYATPWATLNEITCGYHTGELIVWSAKAKAGKTWVLIEQARQIWREEEVPIVFITKEMGTNSILARLHALECGFEYESVRKGKLTKEQQEKYFSYLINLKKEEDEGRPKFHVFGYELSDGVSGVSSLVPKVERHLLDGGALFVDGMYLMPDDRGEKDWKAIVNVSMDLKNLSLSYNKFPVIATTQHNMEDKSDVPRMDGTAYGKYIVQYVDALLGIGRSQQDRDLDRGRVYVLAQREGDLASFPINMKFNPLDFSEIYEKRVKETYDEDETVLY